MFFLMMKMLFKVKKADSILTCARMCRREAACKEANLLANNGTCSLFGEGQQSRKVDKFVERNGSFYIKKVYREFWRFFRYHFVLYNLFFYSVRSQMDETFSKSQIF